ncbi:hypothetical protein DXG01_001441, partial [Tephrocybe rancida]
MLDLKTVLWRTKLDQLWEGLHSWPKPPEAAEEERIVWKMVFSVAKRVSVIDAMEQAFKSVVSLDLSCAISWLTNQPLKAIPLGGAHIKEEIDEQHETRDVGTSALEGRTQNNKSNAPVSEQGRPVAQDQHNSLHDLPADKGPGDIKDEEHPSGRKETSDGSGNADALEPPQNLTTDKGPTGGGQDTNTKHDGPGAVSPGAGAGRKGNAGDDNEGGASSNTAGNGSGSGDPQCPPDSQPETHDKDQGAGHKDAGQGNKANSCVPIEGDNSAGGDDSGPWDMPGGKMVDKAGEGGTGGSNVPTASPNKSGDSGQPAPPQEPPAGNGGKDAAPNKDKGGDSKGKGGEGKGKEGKGEGKEGKGKGKDGKGKGKGEKGEDKEGK